MSHFFLSFLPQIRDLLSRTKAPGGLRVREDPQLGFFVEGLKWVPCEDYAQIEKLVEQGSKIRMTASTNMNASSSRSHMLIAIQFKQVGCSSATGSWRAGWEWYSECFQSGPVG